MAKTTDTTNTDDVTEAGTKRKRAPMKRKPIKVFVFWDDMSEAEVSKLNKRGVFITRDSEAAMNKVMESKVAPVALTIPATADGSLDDEGDED